MYINKIYIPLTYPICKNFLYNIYIYQNLPGIWRLKNPQVSAYEVHILGYSHMRPTYESEYSSLINLPVFQIKFQI